MKPIHVLMKPSSGNCNMRCEYCFYYDTMEKRQKSSYGFMSVETLEAVIRKTLCSAAGSYSITFQGGEPTLSGLDFFKKAVEFEKKYNVNHVPIYNAIQTNGYRLTEEWADFFRENHFLVGVSLDGVPKLHDRFRKNIKGEGTFQRIMENIRMLGRKGVEFNILSVVNGKTAPYIKKNYEFYRKNNLNYLQFIACLDPLNETPGQKEYSLTPEAYGSFLIELFDLWYIDLLQGKQPYIRQFENYIAMILGQMPESCDMRGVCSLQYVVEADGSVYPCDFYVLDEYRLGSFLENTIEEIDKKREETGYIEKSLTREAACDNCPYRGLCRGGCRRSRDSESNYHQYFCKSYQMFLDACLPRLIEIAKRIRRGY